MSSNLSLNSTNKASTPSFEVVYINSRNGNCEIPRWLERGAVCERGHYTPKGVGCEIPHRLERERGTKHSLEGCENLSLTDAFQNLVVSLRCYKWYQSQTLGGVSASEITYFSLTDPF